MTTTKDRVADARANVRPYLERAVRDRELHQNVRNAYGSARAVYDQLVRRRGVSQVATHLASDKDLQNELRNAIEELRNAAARVQGVRREPQEPAHSGRNGLLLLTGIVIGVLFNPVTGPWLRRVLAKRLFGGENGFVYRGNGSVS
jgi:hypothetical protein